MGDKMKKYIKKLKTAVTIYFSRFINLIFIIFTRLDKNKILFLSDVRENLGGNLKEMYDYINDDFKKIVILKRERSVKRSLKEKIVLIYHLSTSKYILLDDFSNSISCLILRKNQEVVQLWHGPGAFKKMGYSRSDQKRGLLSKYRFHRNYTKAIVTSPDIKWCFKEGFGMNDNAVVGATGYPRTDIFFNDKYKDNTKKEFYKKYPKIKNKKLILFAPTYRGNSLPTATYDFDKLDLDKLYKELKKEYVFIFKWHPAIYNNLKNGTIKDYDLSKYKDFFYDLSEYRDINDLLLVCDTLITDYSSVIFDYVLLKKPVIYFTYDLNKYEEERGLYFPFKDYIYGSIAKTTNELIKSIKERKMYEDERKKFIKKFMISCDGNSTKKTYEFIFKKKKY